MTKSAQQAPTIVPDSITDKEMILRLVHALQVVVDTPKSGPCSVGDWKTAEKHAVDAMTLARSRDNSIP